MRLTKGTILVLYAFHAAEARPLEDHQLTTTTHGHITERADPAGPGTSSIADSRQRPKDSTKNPAGEAGLQPEPNQAPRRVTLELITDSTGCYVELDVGTPAKTFILTLDTGSSDTWIVGSNKPDHKGEWYDPGASSTAQRIEEPNTVTVKYLGDLPGEGTTFSVYRDTVTVDDLTIQTVPIGAAQTWSDQSLSDNGDGILALGPSPLASSVRVGNMQETSTLTLGGFDPMAMDGEFTDLRVFSDSDWLVLADSISVDGVKTPIAISVLAIIDTGTAVILGRLEPVRKLHRAIPGSREDQEPTPQGLLFFIIPCDSTATITFVFAGQPFQIAADQLIGDQIPETFDCWSNIVASFSNRSVNSFWILGLPFLQSVYTKLTLPQADGSDAQVSFAKLRKSSSLL